MNLYTKEECDQLILKVEEITKNADAISSKIIRPTLDELWDIVFTVRDFVKENKRKIYGGFALNKLIETVDKNDKFYMDDDIGSWDIDFYSPTPIEDAKRIANILHKKGYRRIQAREAQHEETYKVFAETNDCADITYVPKNIYNKMPFKEIDGLYLTGPHFMMIDYYRVLTDPLISYQIRLEKTFTRLYLMMKHYPLPVSTSNIDIIQPGRDLDVIFRAVHKFLTDRPSTVVVGMYPYNHLLRESGIIEKNKIEIRQTDNAKKQKKNQQLNYVDINYYEVISTHYKKDAKDLIFALKEKFPNSDKRVTYQENYPLFQYLGYSVDIMFDDEIVCRMYHNNSRCCPYFDVPALYFKKGSFDTEKGSIRIGTFSLQMLYNLINVMRAKTNDDANTKNLYYTMLSHLGMMKHHYMTKTQKTIFDDSLFQEFVLRCVGDTLTPQMEKAIRIEKKIEAGKKYSWSYNPANERDKNNETRYVFKNSSGNPIRNEKNTKIDLNAVYSGDDEIDDLHEVEESIEENDKTK